MPDYKKGMRLIYYESRELEIVNPEASIQKGEPFAEFYFHNIYELAELIKTSPEATRKLKELL